MKKRQHLTGTKTTLAYRYEVERQGVFKKPRYIDTSYLKMGQNIVEKF